MQTFSVKQKTAKLWQNSQRLFYREFHFSPLWNAVFVQHRLFKIDLWLHILFHYTVTTYCLAQYHMLFSIENLLFINRETRHKEYFFHKIYCKIQMPIIHVKYVNMVAHACVYWQTVWQTDRLADRVIDIDINIDM